MKKLLLLLLFLFIIAPKIYAQEPLKASVSLIDNVPKGLYGTWKVVSVQTYCSNPMLSVPLSIDEWNLSRSGDVITLTNPQTGASASVKLDEVKKNSVKFTKSSFTKTEHATETPNITINGENFVGTDKIVVENYKSGRHVSTDIWIFKVKAKKISGASAGAILKK